MYPVSAQDIVTVNLYIRIQQFSGRKKKIQSNQRLSDVVTSMTASC
jgi:hypothetical protein